MKQKLRFTSEEEFQSFFGQLSSAEISDFLPVEGSGGDKGFDGLSGTTAYQAYFPDEKNRTDAKYINKINEDLDKVIKNKRRLGLGITDWIFVVPEDLRISVVAHLRKKSKETGINCTYWGATKLLELITKHPHIQDSFPTIFLPPVHEEVKKVTRSLDSGIKATLVKADSPVEIITEQEFARQKREIQNELYQKLEPYYSGSRPIRGTADERVPLEQEAEQKYRDLQIKKQASDNLYKLELEEIEEKYQEETEKTNEEMNKRGLFHSGIKDRAIGRLEVKKKREIEKLKLKYGKTGLITITDTLLGPRITVFSMKTDKKKK